MVQLSSDPTVSSQAVVAAFDFDGTLTTSDSVVPFLRRLAGPRSLIRALRYLPAATVGLVQRDRDRLRSAASLAVLRGIPASRLQREADDYANHIIATRLRPDTTARLEWHRQQGHRVVLVSASYQDYLDGVAQHLGIEAVMATRLEVIDGVCTGRLLGANCRGPEKVARLHAWLSEVGLDRGRVTVWAYGDSAGDDDLLADADYPSRVDGLVVTVSPDSVVSAPPVHPGAAPIDHTVK